MTERGGLCACPPVSCFTIFPSSPFAVIFFFFFFGHGVQLLHLGSQFPDQGLNLGHRVKAPSPNHYTTRELPSMLLNVSFFLSLSLSLFFFFFGVTKLEKWNAPISIILKPDFCQLLRCQE